MLDWCQEIKVSSFGVNCDQLLIEVRLDTLIELKVNICVLVGQLDSHDNLTALVDPEFADFGSILAWQVIAEIVLS